MHMTLRPPLLFVVAFKESHQNLTCCTSEEGKIASEILR